MRIDRSRLASNFSADRLRQDAYYSLFFLIAALTLSNAWFEIASSLFIGLSVLSFVRKPDKILFARPFFVLILAYFFAVLLSLSQTHFWEPSIRGVFKVMKSILLCLSAIYVLDSEDKVREVFQAFLIFGVVVSLDAAFQAMTGRDILFGRKMTPYSTGAGRWTGPFKHANDFSAYLSFVIFLFFGALKSGPAIIGKKRYWVYAAGSALIAASLVFTYSRGAWVAVGLAGLIFVICHRRKWVTAVFAVAFVWLAFFSPAPVHHRFVSLFNAENSTIREREELWGEAGRMVRSSPLLGLGINTYARNEPNFKEPGIRLDNQYAHNGYLQMAAETGLVGLGAFLAVIAFFLWQVFWAFCRTDQPFLKSAGIAFSCGILAFLVHSATDTDLHSLLLVNTLWLAMGIAWAAKDRLSRPDLPA